MQAHIPRASTLRHVGTGLQQIPAAALAVRTDPHADLNAAATLLESASIALLTWHPAVSALLAAAGARTDTATSVSLPVEGPSARGEDIAVLVRRLNPNVWTQTPDDVERLLGARPAASSHPGPATIVVSRHGRRATLSLIVHVSVPGPAGAPLRTGKAVRLTPAQLTAMLTTARRAGLVTTDADTPGRLTRLGWLVDRRLMLHPTPGAPGWASRDSGDLVTSNVPDHAPASAATRAAAAVRGQVAVAIDPHVADVASIAAASPAPIDGLRPWQQEFIGRYLASSFGLVNALPPGVGKTACAAGAMAAQVAAGASSHRGIVVAAASLLGQWVSELARFHPSARVVLAATGVDLDAARHAWAQPAPAVLVCTPELAAAHLEVLTTLDVDDLVVDEATFLRSDSERTRAMWALRARARRAAALTGTPEGDSGRTLQELVAFTRARHDLFTGACPVPAPLLERCGPLVFTAPASVVTSMPAFTPEVVALEPGPAERAIEAAARQRVAAVLDAAHTPAQQRRAAAKVKSELDAWRLGLCCPPALAGSKYALASAAAQSTPSSAKITWASSWVSSIVAQGRSVLVFADSVPALEAAVAQFQGAGVHAAALTSKVRPAKRGELVEQFQNGHLPVLALTATGQLGLNLQAASAVVHLDVPTTEPMFVQRTARAARMGSTHERIDVAVPVLAATAEVTWWAHASGARAGTDLLSLARELTG